MRINRNIGTSSNFQSERKSKQLKSWESFIVTLVPQITDVQYTKFENRSIMKIHHRY